MKKIKMLDSTFDSNKKKLPRGERFEVSDDEKVENTVSSKDAEILVDRGMAEWSEGEAKPFSKMNKPELLEACKKKQIEVPPKAINKDMVALLNASDKGEGTGE